MIKSLLPNCRFLGKSSEHLGRDWVELSQNIDSHFEGLGMDLADQSVFLLFDRAPGSILAGEGGCLVARSVIGPKKNNLDGLQLIDWIQMPVYRKILNAVEWQSVLQQCYTEWENLQRQGIKISAPFMLQVRRRLVPDLILELEVLFHE